MRYFMYSPLVMSEYEAFEAARDSLRENCIVHVFGNSSYVDVIEVLPGKRPQAKKNTYLVRVEPDDSLRTIEKRLD